MKTIVISAVNIVEAGPLAILRNCLEELSSWVSKQQDAYKIIAVVYKRKLADYPNVEYIETQWPKQRWVNRLWFEYVSARKLSKEIGDIYLWFSLHDTTPSVKAKYRAVYCHNALFDYPWEWKDLFYTPKMALLAIMTRCIYLPNIQQNNFLVVQQNWFREKMAKLFKFNKQHIIVAPPAVIQKGSTDHKEQTSKNVKSFIFAGSPNKHKNFEVICKAVAILQEQYSSLDFKVYITVNGSENPYAQWLYDTWGNLPTLQFIGFLSKDVLDGYYASCDCLIFPSKCESWGLPISEFADFNKYMLLADLPYARESAAGSKRTAFFDPNNAEMLADKMKKLIDGKDAEWQSIPTLQIDAPYAPNWQELFNTLTKSN